MNKLKPRKKYFSLALILFFCFINFFGSAPAAQDQPYSPSLFCSRDFSISEFLYEEGYQNKTIFWDLVDDVVQDYLTYYTGDSLLYFGGSLIFSGISANSNLDNSIQHFYQKNIRSDFTDQSLRPFRNIGFYHYIKVYAGIYLLGHLTPLEASSTFGYSIYQWAYRCLRAWTIVSPQITLLRNLLGGGRPHTDPNEIYKDPYDKSKWRPFVYGRPSCSGHTFNGALPFLTAARMSDDPPLRYTFYALSLLPGLSRINDDKHYFSQVFLGWTLAFLAARAVDQSDCDQGKDVKLMLIPLERGAACQVCFRF